MGLSEAWDVGLNWKRPFVVAHFFRLSKSSPKAVAEVLEQQTGVTNSQDKKPWDLIRHQGKGIADKVLFSISA